MLQYFFVYCISKSFSEPSQIPLSYSQVWLAYCWPDFQLKKKLQVPNFVGDSYHYLRVLSSLLFTIPLIFHAAFIRYFLPFIRSMTILTYARWINVLFTCHMGSSRVIHLSSGSSSAVGWLLLFTLCRSLQIVCKPWGPWCTSLG